MSHVLTLVLLACWRGLPFVLHCAEELWQDHSKLGVIWRGFPNIRPHCISLPSADKLCMMGTSPRGNHKTPQNLSCNRNIENWNNEIHWNTFLCFNTKRCYCLIDNRLTLDHRDWDTSHLIFPWGVWLKVVIWVPPMKMEVNFENHM